MPLANQKTLRLSTGTTLAFTTEGDPSKPALLLLHGVPTSSYYFRDLIPLLADAAFVIAPDMPGAGGSEPLPDQTFAAETAAISELLAHLQIGPRVIYLHDYGTPVGLQLAMDQPDQLLGLIIQNANAHRTGLDEGWGPTKQFWADPSPENLAQATQHLTFEGTRNTYLSGVPEEIAARISPLGWEDDWRVLTLPGRMDVHRQLLADYGNYVARFDAIRDWLRQRQPPALMVWGRHDIYFALPETLSWMEDLPRMEVHVIDAGHLLLETHANEAARLIRKFVGTVG